MSAPEPRDRATWLAVLCASAAIVAFLFWLIYFQQPPEGPANSRPSFLPALNAGLNLLSASLLTAGLVFIKRGRKRTHGWFMAGATLASLAFLGGYLLYHYLHGDTQFLAQGWIRPVYFAILISHIILSVVAVPLVAMTLLLALRRRWPQHRKLAKLTYPIWLYVSLTGVAVFLFLRFFNTTPLKG